VPGFASQIAGLATVHHKVSFADSRRSMAISGHFAEKGAVSEAEANEAMISTQLLLAREAVDLVLRDVERTTSLGRMSFDVRYDEAFETIVVSHQRSYQTPAIFSYRAPESVAEIADNMQDLIVDELSGAWPTCPNHRSGLYAQVEGDDAVWCCRVGSHAVSVIGHL
jgi:hypothetical protein